MLYQILEKSLQHLFISLSALFIALCIAMPLGFFLTKSKSKKISLVTIRTISLIQTMPGLAMIALIVVFLSGIRFLVPVPCTGYLPGILSLSLYALSPILTNTYTGIKQTSPQMVDVATGLGMTRRQILHNVEIPSAIPMIIAGIRIAGVWTIGMCTLTSLVGCGGLGELILQGLRSMNAKYVLAGTIPAAILAVFFEWGMSALEKWLKGESV